VSRLHRAIARLIPEPHREWLLAHDSEGASIEGRAARLRWMLGALPIAGRAIASQAVHDPRSLLGGALMRTVVVTMSLLVAAVGTIVLGAYALMTEHPATMLPFALVPIVQGAFTLLFALGKLNKLGGIARLLELSGSTLALSVGAVGFAYGVVVNLTPMNVDPEYAPMAVSLLVAMHGLIALLAFAPTSAEPVGA